MAACSERVHAHQKPAGHAAQHAPLSVASCFIILLLAVAARAEQKRIYKSNARMSKKR